MKRLKKAIIRIFRLKRIYFGIGRLIRNTIEKNDTIHGFISKTVFDLSNIFGWNLHHVPFFLAQKISSSDIVIDCGANVGVIVKPLLKYKPMVYCFEPNPMAFFQLTKNLGSSENIKLFDKAVGVEEKKAKLFKHFSSVDSSEKELLHSVSASLLSNKRNVDDDNFYEVEVINFISFLNNLNGHIYILKIDIEGAEVELVNALLDHALYDKISYLFVETHENTIPELKESTRDLIRRTKDMGLRNVYFNWA